jgi:hypothetical protein
MEYTRRLVNYFELSEEHGGIDCLYAPKKKKKNFDVSRKAAQLRLDGFVSGLVTTD